MKSPRPFLVVALVALCSNGLQAGAPAEGERGYVVVVSRATQADPAWKRVVEALIEKHRAGLAEFAEAVTEVLPRLQHDHPRHVCFVARPQEATRAFVAQVHRLTRQLDNDPYPDCFWGILTGYDAANALRLAQLREPLTIRKVASGTEVALEMCEEGVWYCELTQGKVVRKEKGGVPVASIGPADSTEALVRTLNDYQADLFVTSGHATERDWMIGFRYRNGFFKHQGGQLYGLDTQDHPFPIHSPNPKVYLPVGNCLMGHIDQPDCMALSWLNSAGVVQMLGYTEPTWYGYAGWGVLDYFVEQPGRFTFTEAFFANQLALVHRLTSCFPELTAATLDTRGRPSITPKLSPQARAAGLTLQDARGLLFDRDVLACYGDPAWIARLADAPKAFDQRLTAEGDRFVFEILPRRGDQSFATINRNGSQRGGRPFVAFLPHRVEDVHLIEGAELDPVIADDFILVPHPGTCDPAKTYRVTFTATPIRPAGPSAP